MHLTHSLNVAEISKFPANGQHGEICFPRSGIKAVSRVFGGPEKQSMFEARTTGSGNPEIWFRKTASIRQSYNSIQSFILKLQYISIGSIPDAQWFEVQHSIKFVVQQCFGMRSNKMPVVLKLTYIKKLETS